MLRTACRTSLQLRGLLPAASTASRAAFGTYEQVCSSLGPTRWRSRGMAGAGPADHQSSGKAGGGGRRDARNRLALNHTLAPLPQEHVFVTEQEQVCCGLGQLVLTE